MAANSNSTLYVSRTGRQYGYGHDKYKKVTFLTTDERTRVYAGEKIFFRADRISARGPNGTYWRVAKVCGSAIGPRVPSLEEITELRRKTGSI